jgi:transcriptional regulator with XRE-family HTH domain
MTGRARAAAAEGRGGGAVRGSETGVNNDAAVYETVAVELVRALRGRRSCADVSRRMGYRSNIVHRWESRHSWPTAARFLQAHRRLHPDAPCWLQQFFHALPAWARHHDPTSAPIVALFLQNLRGKTPVLRVAELMHQHRSSVSRWLSGAAQPNLPEFLRLVDVLSRRMPDLVAALEDPSRLPSLQKRWEQLQLARRAGYELPWSHAVLRALELEGAPHGLAAQRAWIARHLGIGTREVEEALAVLEGAAQIVKTSRGYRLREVTAIDTGRDPERARALKAAWLQTALARLQSSSGGRFGYSIFAVSRADLAQLHDLHLQYVRAMQNVIARSAPAECVGLYCSQLLDLGEGAVNR